MKLFIRILLFVFVALVTNVKVISATITFPNIQETTKSFSFHNEIPKSVFKAIENDIVNCCQNGQDLVDYRNWGIGVEAVAAKGVSTEMTTVGRWMSKGEYAAMKNGTTVLEGAGGQTFVTQGGSHLFTGAARGAVYAEFQVPTNSFLQGSKQGWLKMLGPNASKSQQYLLHKQGGSLLPQYQNLSPILQIK